MRIRIRNKWNKVEQAFDKALYDIKESDKTISGRFVMSAKKDTKDGQEKWVSANMPFMAFKNNIDLITKNAIIHHGGKFLDVEGYLTVELNQVDNKGYFKFVITSAKGEESKEPVQSFHDTSREEEDSAIPF